jgi:hypothetical protein
MSVTVQQKAIWLLAVAAGGLLLALAIWQRHVEAASAYVPPVEADPTSAPVAHISRAVRVEVLNGCGKPAIAGRVTRRARAAGMDVIDEGNAETFGFLNSMVIDRRGNLAKAQEVAAAMGIPICIQQVRDDPSRLAEVSIVIGRDYRRIHLVDP